MTARRNTSRRERAKKVINSNSLLLHEKPHKQKKKVKMEAQFVCFSQIIGYKASTNLQGSILDSKLGFSHEIRPKVPPSVRVFCLKHNIIRCMGMDLKKVTKFAASIKSCKPPEVYKGRGIRYQNEVIQKKPGKKKQIMPYILGTKLVSSKQVRIAPT